MGSTAPMLLILASCLAFSVIISSGANPKSSQPMLQMQDYGSELDYNQALASAPEAAGPFEAYAPGDSFMAEVEAALAPSPDDDKDYDSLDALSESMQLDIDLAKARPDLVPSSPPEIAKAEMLAHNKDLLARQVLNDSSDVVKTLNAMAPGPDLSISLPPMPPSITVANVTNVTSGVEKAAAVVSVASFPALLGLLGFLY